MLYRFVNPKVILENLLAEVEDSEDKLCIKELLRQFNCKGAFNSPQQNIFEELLHKYRPNMQNFIGGENDRETMV